jgi:hypothetical protein
MVLRAFTLLVSILALAVAGCGDGSGSSGSGRSMTGDEIANTLSNEFTDPNGNPIMVTCPNQRLVVGDKIECRVDYSDGSYHQITATLEANGHVEIDAP